MKRDNALLLFLDKTSTAVASLAIITDELSNSGYIEEKAKRKLTKDIKTLKSSIAEECWEYVIDITNARWNDLDIKSCSHKGLCNRYIYDLEQCEWCNNYSLRYR